MTNQEILRTAMEQSAVDINCRVSDFLCDSAVIVKSGVGSGARKYYKEPIACNLVSYGNNIVASVREEYRQIVEEYIGRYEYYHCFETPNMHWLNERLLEKGQKICFMAEYYLPDVEKLHELPCRYELKLLKQPDFAELYQPEWSNALCSDRKELDVLGIGAYDGGKLIGLAGCSADCDTMWQIGVDVLPEYRRQGTAAALTSALALEILKRGKVPFYCSAWSNIRSVRNAVKSGFIPAWVEMTAKPKCIVDAMNLPENMNLKERFEFRNIQREEADQAALIEKICFPPNEACSEAMMKERAVTAPDLFLVAVDKETGRIAGFLNGLSTNEDSFRDEFFTDARLYDPAGMNVMLLGLDVLPEYRRQGLAREIVSQYLCRECERGRKRVILTCLEAKVPMYERMGFHNDGIAESSWGGEQWYEMSYVL